MGIPGLFEVGLLFVVFSFLTILRRRFSWRTLFQSVAIAALVILIKIPISN